MKPHIHAKNFSKRFGGTSEEYQEFGDWFDSSKAHFPDMRHRAVLHSGFGVMLFVQFFSVKYKSPWFVNSEGKQIDWQELGEWHVKEDLGYVPSLADYLKEMKLQKWMAGSERHLLAKELKEKGIELEEDEYYESTQAVD